MKRIGPVRAVEVLPSAGTSTPASGKDPKKAPREVPRALDDFDVQALLEEMPAPRSSKPGEARGAARKGRGSGGGSEGAVAAGLGVDVWVQFESFLGFRRALKAFRGRVLQKAGAELLCEYRVQVEEGSFMSDKKRKERADRRVREAEEVRATVRAYRHIFSCRFCLARAVMQILSPISGLRFETPRAQGSVRRRVKYHHVAEHMVRF